MIPTTGDRNNSEGIRAARVVILESRLLWFVSFDATVLAAIGCVAIVGGLGDLSLCRWWTFVMILLQSIELIVLLVAQPFTSIFALVYAATTLLLSCLSATFQYVFIVHAIDSVNPSMWPIEAAAFCSFAVVGVTAVKMAADFHQLAGACVRRFFCGVGRRGVTSEAGSLLALKLREDDGADSVDHQTATTKLLLHIDDEMFQLSDDVFPVVGEMPCLLVSDLFIKNDQPSYDFALDDAFWDVDGNARTNDDERTDLQQWL